MGNAQRSARIESAYVPLDIGGSMKMENDANEIKGGSDQKSFIMEARTYRFLFSSMMEMKIDCK